MTDDIMLSMWAFKLGMFLLAGGLFTVLAPDARAAGEPPERDAIEDGYKWNPGDLFADDEAWEKAFTELEGQLGTVAAYQGRLGESPATLLEAFQAWEAFAARAEHLYQYASLNGDQDTRVNKYQGMQSRIFALWVRFDQESSYMSPELLAMPEEQMTALMDDPVLETYRFYLERIGTMRPYTLDADKEALLASSAEVVAAPGEIFDLFTNADLQFPTIKDSKGNDVVVNNTTWYQLRSDNDREVRKAALEGYYGTYHGYRNTLAQSYSSHVKGDLFEYRARGFDSSLQAKLYPNNIPNEVYTNLIDTVNANLEPLHRYVALKKKVLGLETFEEYDVFAPLVGEVEKSYEWDQAVAMVLEAVQPLGDQYVSDLRAGFEAGWADVYETQGKKSGAYCSTVFDMHPFVLLNYHGELDDVSTVAHEMGHAMHGYYSNEHQPYIYHDHAIFVAEVASTTNELMMIQKLIDETKDPELKLYLLDFWANQIINTVYRQTYFAEFEIKAHEAAESGEALTADSMTAMYHEIFQRYYGEDLQMLDGRLDMCWARIPHFYRSFYVYQYATSYAAAMSLVQGFSTGKKKDRKARQEAYLGFLGAGESKYPIDILKDAGVDMTTPTPIEDCLQKFGEIVTEMEKLTAK